MLCGVCRGIGSVWWVGGMCRSIGCYVVGVYKDIGCMWCVCVCVCVCRGMGVTCGW